MTGLLLIVMAMLAGFTAGLAIGAAFFALLATSVERLPGASNPALLMVGSLVARMLIAAAGFLIVARLCALPGVGGALLGFIVARVWAIRRQAETGEVREAGGPASGSGVDR